MNRKVLGRNVIVSMLVDGNYYPIFCGKTASLDLTQDKIEVTHVNSGAHRNFVPGMTDSTFSVQGVTLINNDEQKVSIVYLDQLAIRRSINTFRVLLTDQDGINYTISLSAFVLNTSLSRDVNAWSQSSVTFQITDDWVFSSVVAPPVLPTCEEQDPIFGTLADGSAVFTSALLIQGVGETITILHVARSGTTYYITSGTPGNLEYKYNSAAGTITFQNVGNPADPNLEPIAINYKKTTP
jgi:hypothetical protein